MNVWTWFIFVFFLGIVGYLLRDFFLAKTKEGFQTSDFVSGTWYYGDTKKYGDGTPISGCTTVNNNNIPWSMKSAYMSGGTENIHWKYTDNPNDPDCLNNWSYYDTNGNLLYSNIPNITKIGDTRNWCGLRSYRSGTLKGKAWDDCPIPPPAPAIQTSLPAGRIFMNLVPSVNPSGVAIPTGWSAKYFKYILNTSNFTSLNFFIKKDALGGEEIINFFKDDIRLSQQSQHLDTASDLVINNLSTSDGSWVLFYDTTKRSIVAYTTPSGSYQNIGTQPNFTINNLQQNTTYTFIVKAFEINTNPDYIDFGVSVENGSTKIPIEYVGYNTNLTTLLISPSHVFTELIQRVDTNGVAIPPGTGTRFYKYRFLNRSSLFSSFFMRTNGIGNHKIRNFYKEGDSISHLDTAANVDVFTFQQPSTTYNTATRTINIVSTSNTDIRNTSNNYNFSISNLLVNVYYTFIVETDSANTVNLGMFMAQMNFVNGSQSVPLQYVGYSTNIYDLIPAPPPSVQAPAPAPSMFIAPAPAPSMFIAPAPTPSVQAPAPAPSMFIAPAPASITRRFMNLVPELTPSNQSISSAVSEAKYYKYKFNTQNFTSLNFFLQTNGLKEEIIQSFFQEGSSESHLTSSNVIVNITDAIYHNTLAKTILTIARSKFFPVKEYINNTPIADFTVNNLQSNTNYTFIVKTNYNDSDIDLGVSIENGNTIIPLEYIGYSTNINDLLYSAPAPAAQSMFQTPAPVPFSAFSLAPALSMSNHSIIYTKYRFPVSLLSPLRIFINTIGNVSHIIRNFYKEGTSISHLDNPSNVFINPSKSFVSYNLLSNTININSSNIITSDNITPDIEIRSLEQGVYYTFIIESSYDNKDNLLLTVNQYESVSNNILIIVPRNKGSSTDISTLLPAPAPAPSMFQSPAPASSMFRAPAPAPSMFRAPAPTPSMFRAPAPAPSSAAQPVFQAPAQSVRARAPAVFRAPVSARIQQLQSDDILFRQTADKLALTANLEQQRDLFHYGYGSNSLPIDAAILAANPDLRNQLDQATATRGNPVRISQSIVEVGSQGPTLQERLNVCQQYQTPADIPANNSSGCGWYFVPDISGATREYRSSYCVPGNEQGVSKSLVGLPEGGTWMWNKDAAIAAEAKKFCKRGTVCGFQNTDESCAFCVDKGHSIPFDRLTQQPLYGEKCSRIISNPRDCPADASVDMCATTTDASIKKDCFLKLLTVQGVATTGLLYKHVNGKLEETEKARFNTLLQVLNTRARWRTDLLETTDLAMSGKLDIAGLTRKIRKIVAAKTSYDAIVAGIARHFVDGTFFDSTAYYYQTAQQIPDSKQKEAQTALALQDLQQEFRKAGCQAAGADYPTALPPSNAPSSALADHRTKFQGLYLNMFNEQDDRQKDAIRRCLNATYNTGPSAAPTARGSFCNEPGIEYLIYSPATGPFATLIARLNSPVGFLGSDSSYGEANDLRKIMENEPLADQLQVGYIARTMFSLEDPNVLTGGWKIPTDGSYQMRINGSAISISGTAGPDIPYTVNQPSFLELQYIIETSDKSKRRAWGKPEYAYIFRNLRKFRLVQEFFKPFMQFDFAQGSQDLNRFATLQPVNPTVPIQFTPKFTSAPTAAPTPNIDASWGLMNPVLLTPRIRSSLIHIIDLTVYMATSGILFKLKEDDSYYEQFRVESRAMIYTVFNGSESKEYRAEFPTDFSPYGRSQRFVLVFTKQDISLTVQFIYDNDGLKTLKTTALSPSSTQSLTQSISGSIGFKRSLQVQLLDQGFKGSLQKFGIYDRKSLQAPVAPVAPAPVGAEGFQNQLDIPDILQERSITDRIQPEQTQTIDRSTYVPRTILGNAPSSSVGIGAPADSCRFTPKPISLTGFQYSEKYEYNKVFASAVSSGFDTKNSLKECYDACAGTMGCVGMNYASDTGKCTYYQSINSNDMTDEPNSISIIMPEQNKNLVDMRNRVRAVIKVYADIRNALKETPDMKTKFNDTTLYIDRQTITDENVAADLKAIDSINSIECLNAFLEKYTLTTK